MSAAAMTSRAAIAFVKRHGVVLESGVGRVPCLVDAIAGRRVAGSWWGAPEGQLIFRITRAVRDAKEVLTCRLVDGKVTFVHRRLWPALVRLAPRLDAVRLAARRDVHTASGAHQTVTTAFPDWVPADVRRQARSASDDDALLTLAAAIGLP